VVASRSLESLKPTVQPAKGTTTEILARVRQSTNGGVYVDRSDVARQVFEADLIDEAMITVIPKDIGAGVKLLMNASQKARLGEPVRKSYPSGAVQERYFLR